MDNIFKALAADPKRKFVGTHILSGGTDSELTPGTSASPDYFSRLVNFLRALQAADPKLERLVLVDYGSEVGRTINALERFGIHLNEENIFVSDDGRIEEDDRKQWSGYREKLGGAEKISVFGCFKSLCVRRAEEQLEKEFSHLDVEVEGIITREVYEP